MAETPAASTEKSPESWTVACIFEKVPDLTLLAPYPRMLVLAGKRGQRVAEHLSPPAVLQITDEDRNAAVAVGVQDE